MKSDTRRLALVFGTLAILLPLFAWIESRVGYEAFAWGGIAVLAPLAVGGALWTIVTEIRASRKKTDVPRETEESE